MDNRAKIHLKSCTDSLSFFARFWLPFWDHVGPILDSPNQEKTIKKFAVVAPLFYSRIRKKFAGTIWNRVVNVIADARVCVRNASMFPKWGRVMAPALRASSQNHCNKSAASAVRPLQLTGNAKWHCQWAVPGESALPKLQVPCLRRGIG